MSFEWNLSSEEEEGFEDWANVNLKASLTNQHHPAPDKHTDSSSDEEESRNHNQAATVPFFEEPVAWENEVLDSDEDEVDWEDAEEETPAEDKDEDDRKPAANPLSRLKPVTLDLNNLPANEDQSKSKKKRGKMMSRKRYRYEHLPSDLQSFLVNLERSHLLSLTSHAVYASRRCSEDQALHIAHSLIPLAWMGDKDAAGLAAPTQQDLSNFCNFFYSLVQSTPGPHSYANQAAMRPHRRRHNRYRKYTGHDTGSHNFSSATHHYRIQDRAAFLASMQGGGREHDPGFNGFDKLHLFLSMVRSLGWRARYVMAIKPTPKDLDVNHPLFVTMSTRNVFQQVWRESRKKKATDLGDQKTRTAKRPRPSSADGGAVAEGTSNSLSTSQLPTLIEHSHELSAGLVCWAEVLCKCPQKKNGKKDTRKGGHPVKPKMHWVHVDPSRQLINQPHLIEAILYGEQEGVQLKKVKKKVPIHYALAVEHIHQETTDDGLRTRLTDVTPRYASSWIESLKARGVIRGKQTKLKDDERADLWWSEEVLRRLSFGHKNVKKNHKKARGHTLEDAIVLDEAGAEYNVPVEEDHIDEVDQDESRQFKASRQDEPIPTSKSAFKIHPVYVLPSLLNNNEVFVPDAKERVCGVFKGELVFRRKDVETIFPARRWLYRGRKVKDSDLKRPIKRIKARKKPTSSSFKALASYGVGQSNDGSEEARLKEIEAASRPLDDNKEDLFASWQTDPWSPPPVGPSDPIPVNEHKNIELDLLNPGLVHIDERHMAKVAKQLGIPYAPCLLGFEGHGGNRTPTIRGIVVHEHNAEIIREANVEVASHMLQQDHDNRRRAILLKWKKLLVGVLTRDRLDRAYGSDGNQPVE